MATKRRPSAVGRLLARYFGWVALGIALVWWGHFDPVVTAGLVLTAALYIGFRMPTWCGAMTRDATLCRRNANGVLMGCSYRQHRWQKLRLAIIPMAWSELWSRIWRGDKVQALGLIVAAFTAIFGGFQALGTFVGSG
jgi:hypothetical protein